MNKKGLAVGGYGDHVRGKGRGVVTCPGEGCGHPVWWWWGGMVTLSGSQLAHAMDPLPVKKLCGSLLMFKTPLGDFLCIPTPNTGQLNPLFHTDAEFRLIVNRIVARQSTDQLAANAQFSPNEIDERLHMDVRKVPTPLTFY